MLMAVLVSIFATNIFQFTAPYIFPSDDVVAYISLVILTFIYLLALIQRFFELLKGLGYKDPAELPDATTGAGDMNKEDFVKTGELYGLKVLQEIAAALVFFVVILGVSVALYEARRIYYGLPIGNDLDDDYNFFANKKHQADADGAVEPDEEDNKEDGDEENPPDDFPSIPDEKKRRKDKATAL